VAPPPYNGQVRGAGPAAAIGAHRLVRRLGPIDAAAIVISNVIGGGIFFVPVVVAQLVSNPVSMLALWLIGGALAFAGAMAYAELAAVRPHAGGEYVYLRDAFGPLAAFLTGWTSFVAGFSGAIAASAVALADYVTRFVAVPAGARPLIAITAIAALTLIHVRGLGPGRVVQNVLAALKVSAIVVIVALGFAIGHGDAANLAPAGHTAAVPWLLALVPVMFSYSGWNAAAYVAEEVRHPERNVPLALALGTAAVIVLYVGLNALYVYTLSMPQLASLGNARLMDTVAEHLFGFATGNLIAIFTIVSLAASISAMILAGPRVYFAMARDGIFVRAAGRVHPRFLTPATAIVAQAVWSSVLVLSGTLAQLVNYTGFAVVLFSAIAVCALFVLRRRDGAAPRPFSALGYPWAPAIFVLASALMVGNAFWREPQPTLAGVAVILLGVPAYYLFRSGDGPSSARSRAGEHR
jgi:APA family basic amino acid/polyamine antiporter